MADYIATSLMPTLPTETRDLLEDPITLPELQWAIGNTKAGKAPGSDGLTIQYYKILLPSLGNHLVKLLNNLSKGSTLYNSTLQAQISVIPKEGKDPAQCRRYRPISLLNTDLKSFSKIIASKLQQHLPQLIHLDQVGFVPAREARANTTKVLNLLYLANLTKHCVSL